MIEYSTNWMGPVSNHWYENNMIPMIETEQVYSKVFFPEKEGETYTSRVPVVHYATGRIDIYGLDDEKYYCGRDEYGVNVMTQDSWSVLTNWLENFTSEELVPYKELLEEFEKDTGHKIEWFKHES